MNLLIIAPHYLTFIKDQTEELAKHVEHIDVFVPYNRIGTLFEKFPLNKMHNKINRYFNFSELLLLKIYIKKNVFLEK